MLTSDKFKKEMEDSQEEIEGLSERMTALFDLDPIEAKTCVLKLCAKRFELYAVVDDVLEDKSTPDKMKQFILADFVTTILEVLINADPTSLDAILGMLSDRGLIDMTSNLHENETRH